MAEWAILIALLLLVGVYVQTILPLHVRWMAMDEAYSHGYLVIAMVAYSGFQLAREDRLAPHPTYFAALIAFLATLVWFVGYAVQAQLIEQIVLR